MDIQLVSYGRLMGYVCAPLFFNTLEDVIGSGTRRIRIRTAFQSPRTSYRPASNQQYL